MFSRPGGSCVYPRWWNARDRISCRTDGEAPQMLPGGRAVLFSVKKSADALDKGQIVVQNRRRRQKR